MVSSEIVQLATNADQLYLVSQPIVAMRGGIGYTKILMRSSSSTPLEIIQFAEAHQLMPLVDRAIIEMTLNQTYRLSGRFSISLSTQTINDPTFSQWLEQTFQDVEPGRYGFELNSEGCDLKLVTRFVAIARRLNCSIALDNFACRRSDFRLLQLGPDFIKIDGRYVSSMLDNTASAVIVRAACGTAAQHHCKVVATGVNFREIFAEVLNLGCDYGQGDYLGKPEML